MPDINLIPEEAKKSEEFENLRSKISLASTVFLILTAIVAFVTLAFFAFFINKREQLIAKVEDVSATVNNYKTIEELIVVAKDKASVADNIPNSRLNKVTFYRTLTEIIPQNVYFTDIKINPKGSTMNGKARSSADVAGLISSLLSTKGSQIISDVSINSLVSNESGAYTFGLSLTLVK